MEKTYPGYLNNPGALVGGGYLSTVGVVNPLFYLKEYMNKSLTINELANPSKIFSNLSHLIGVEFQKNMISLIKQIVKNDPEFPEFKKKYKKEYSKFGDEVIISYIENIMSENNKNVDIKNLLATYELGYDKYLKLINLLIKEIQKISNERKKNSNPIIKTYNLRTFGELNPDGVVSYLKTNGRELLEELYENLYSIQSVKYYLVNNLDVFKKVSGLASITNPGITNRQKFHSPNS